MKQIALALLFVFTGLAQAHDGDHPNPLRDVYGDDQQFMVMGQTARLFYETLEGVKEKVKVEGDTQTTTRVFDLINCWQDEPAKLLGTGYHCELRYTHAKEGQKLFTPDQMIPRALLDRMVYNKHSFKNLECTETISGPSDNQSYEHMCIKYYKNR